MKFDYLQEKKHIGDQDYLKAKIEIKNKDKGIFSLNGKRNLITNSSEFYDLAMNILMIV